MKITHQIPISHICGIIVRLKEVFTLTRKHLPSQDLNLEFITLSGEKDDVVGVDRNRASTFSRWEDILTQNGCCYIAMMTLHAEQIQYIWGDTGSLHDIIENQKEITPGLHFFTSW